MQTLNLVKAEKSDITWSIINFNDGEKQIVIGEFNRKDGVEVVCRIRNAEELFILNQVLDILNRHAVSIELDIYYLMGMRMDRVMDFNRPFTLKVVMDVLNNYNIDLINVCAPHNLDAIRHLSTNCVEELYPETNCEQFDGFQLVFPDAGAADRYDGLSWYTDNPIIVCDKVRDTKTGKISSIEVTNPKEIRDVPLLVIDDLCDSGGTFVGVAEAIRKINPAADLNIKVCHMVNPKGIGTLAKHYNSVEFTNSYSDWDDLLLPNNVKITEVV